MGYGDSGGPLLVRREGGWVQIGVVLRVNSETHVIAYADLSRHRDWIRSVTGAASSPVVVPPAPPPPPPTFRPTPVEVSLGDSGTTVTLMTAEGGGYTLNGRAFAGGLVTAEDGDKYLLALEDDKWLAVLQESSNPVEPACMSEPPPAVILEWKNDRWTVRLEQGP